MANLSRSLCAFVFLSLSLRAITRRRRSTSRASSLYLCVQRGPIFRLLSPVVSCLLPNYRLPFPSSRLAHLTSLLSFQVTRLALGTLHSRQPLQEEKCLSKIKANVLAAPGAHVSIRSPTFCHALLALPPVSVSTLQSARRGISAMLRHLRASAASVTATSPAASSGRTTPWRNGETIAIFI
ncbi:hypothetical protein BC826DRAFT_1048753 [Russula brevipes]|nr:hypothetical protein BC826DRAFT_1048753 [Russula brevipes]